MAGHRRLVEWRPDPPPERRPARDRGQVMVIFAFAMVAITAAAGLAVDIGRFYSEKRFLQNAADAGALAVANALIRGESTTDADAEGRDGASAAERAYSCAEHAARAGHAGPGELLARALSADQVGAAKKVSEARVAVRGKSYRQRRGVFG